MATRKTRNAAHIIIGSLLTIAIIAIGAGSAVANCDTATTCSDTTSSFWGHVVVEGIAVSWSTAGESSDIAYYRLRRYNCSEPGDCMVDVAVISAVGDCTQMQTYSFIDSPPAPAAAWSYTLELWRTDGSRACAVDVSPQ